jgi:hypothetical protein
MLFYRAALPLSSKTLNFVSGVIRRHRQAIGSLWRALDSGRQALLVLVHLKKGETFAQAAAGFGVGTATAWRYVNETLGLLAARAPKLEKAVLDAKRAGHAYVVVDGTLIPIDRVARDKPFYSGKHKKHGVNLQVIASPHGDVLWVSGGLPGSVHDKRAEWIWGVLDELEAAGLAVLADSGYQGSMHARLPYKKRKGARSSTPNERPTAPTPASAHPASARTPSSRAGEFSARRAAARPPSASSPEPFTSYSFKRQPDLQVEKGSRSAPRKFARHALRNNR